MKRSTRPVYLRRCCHCDAGLLTLDRAYCTTCPEIPMPRSSAPSHAFDTLRTTKWEASRHQARDVRALAHVLADIALELEADAEPVEGNQNVRLRAERKLGDLSSSLRMVALEALRRSNQPDDSLASADLAKRLRGVA